MRGALACTDIYILLHASPLAIAGGEKCGLEADFTEGSEKKSRGGVEIFLPCFCQKKFQTGEKWANLAVLKFFYPVFCQKKFQSNRVELLSGIIVCMNLQIHTPATGDRFMTAKTPQKLLLTQAAAAKLLGVSENILRAWNCPRYYIGRTANPSGRNVRYYLPDVMDWLRKRRSLKK